MRLYILSTFLIVASISLKAQTTQSPECEEAYQKAEADFKNGIRKIYVFGLVSNDKYRQVLRDKYHIEAHYAGCVVSNEKRCYSEYMEAAIGKEKGFGFWERVRLETDTKKLAVPKLF